MNKTNKIIFWTSTGLVSALSLMSAGMYLFNYEEVCKLFLSLGFPIFVIYPLAIAKILGVGTIITRKNKSLVEWAYAGFFFDFLLAVGAHLSIGDGEFGAAAVALVLISTSYIFSKKLQTNETIN